MDKNVHDQVVERLKTANNVLVTVSRNPSVDQLAACIGMTLLLNKLGKHATAVFSGKVPNTIEFLQPEKTLEKNTDSLRDFIIALDKAKADKLRYKVEDEVVKIFITPYKTSISQKDLQFSQGDFNVDVVLALGVHQQTDLDQAIVAHGRILHDAEVISVNNTNSGNLGTTNWIDTKASSLCEMLVGVGNLLNRTAFDAQMSNAFLTGIVAETNRFSNAKVSPDTMTISSLLMSAGASTQLVAAKLEPPKPPEPKPIPIPKHPDSQASLNSEEPKPDGELNIFHESAQSAPESKTELSKPDQIIPDDALDYELHDREEDLATIHIDDEGQISEAPSLVDGEQAASSPPPEPEVELPPVPPPPEPAPEPTPEPPPAPMPVPEPAPVLPPPEPKPAPAPEPVPQPAPLKSVESARKVISEPPQIVPQSDSTGELEEASAINAGPLTLPTDLPAPTPILTHDTSSSTQTITGHKSITPPPEPAPLIVPEPEPKAETINDNETLEDIEQSVDSPHLKPAPTELAPAGFTDNSVDSAREAVNQAISNGTNSNPLAPINALGAQPLGEDLHGQANVTPPAPTPSVPKDEAIMPGPTFVEPTVGAPPNLVPPQSTPEDSAPPPGPPPMMPPPIYPAK